MKHLVPANRSRQSGAVLIVAMVLLVVLTLLGVTAMNITSMQERIVANSQEQLHAFQAAEVGLSQAFADPAIFKTENLDGYYDNEVPVVFAGTEDKAGYSTRYMAATPPPPGSLYSATSFEAAHFHFRSTGESQSGQSVILNGGIFTIRPKL